MTAVYGLDRIRAAIEGIDLLPAIADGFVRFSRGEAVVPPVGELLFDDPPGDVHIKYGYIAGDEHYLVKIASGFYRNVDAGLNPTPGCMIVASQRTGVIEAVLLEDGYLTNLRTALAGAVAAKHLAPSRIERIGVFGAGVQARMQVEALARVTNCREVVAWARRRSATEQLAAALAPAGFRVTVVDTPREAADCDLLVTTTASEAPYLTAAMLRPGTHITAMGSDTERKTELAPDVLARADIVVADSRAQAAVRGEIHHAVAAGLIAMSGVRELGKIIADPSLGRTSDRQITVTDLTGVAVQDIVIAKAVLARLR